MTASSVPRLGATAFTSFDQASFGYRQWLPEGRKPHTIIIGVHGISGAAVDFENLGRHLQSHRSGIGVMAYELRGQGNDPVSARRGDIRHPRLWFDDLRTFTGLVRRKFPDARIVWFGESMGSLIVLHTFHHTPGPPPCDALVLSSPVVSTGDNLPAWKKAALKLASRAAPRYRVSLEDLSGDAAVQVTSDSIHQDQAAVTPWHVRLHTLRLLNTLGRLIDAMPRVAERIHLPTLVLHGGRDYFNRPEEIDRFFRRFPPNPRNRLQHYPESYHLLMYDRQREQVFEDLRGWIEALERRDGR